MPVQKHSTSSMMRTARAGPVQGQGCNQYQSRARVICCCSLEFSSFGIKFRVIEVQDCEFLGFSIQHGWPHSCLVQFMTCQQLLNLTGAFSELLSLMPANPEALNH